MRGVLIAVACASCNVPSTRFEPPPVPEPPPASPDAALAAPARLFVLDSAASSGRGAAGAGAEIDVIAADPTPRLVKTIDLHEVSARTLAVSHDGSRAYVALDWGVQIVDVASGTVRHTTPIPGASVVALSSDEATVWTTSATGIVGLDAVTGEIRASFPLAAPMLGIAATSGQVAVASYDSVYLLDPASGTIVRVPLTAPTNGHCGVQAEAVVYAPDRLLAWDPNCAAFYQIDLASRAQLPDRTLQWPRPDGVPDARNAATYSPTTGRVYALLYPGDIAIGDPVTLATHQVTITATGWLTGIAELGGGVFAGVRPDDPTPLARVDTSDDTITPAALILATSGFAPTDMAVVR